LPKAAAARAVPRDRRGSGGGRLELPPRGERAEDGVALPRK
jgi:hypothetical protein